jgi:hypothetical protein
MVRTGASAGVTDAHACRRTHVLQPRHPYNQLYTFGHPALSVTLTALTCTTCRPKTKHLLKSRLPGRHSVTQLRCALHTHIVVRTASDCAGRSPPWRRHLLPKLPTPPPPAVTFASGHPQVHGQLAVITNEAERLRARVEELQVGQHH